MATPAFPKKRGERSSARRRRGAFSERAGPRGLTGKLEKVDEVRERRLEKVRERRVEKVRERRFEKVRDRKFKTVKGLCSGQLVGLLGEVREFLSVL